MDKNAIKKYAVWARKELIARVTQKAEQYEITEDKITSADADSIGGRLLTNAEKKQRSALIERINTDGFEQVMEEVAYTWFNRFTALRFMEVNNYLPSHTRVFTNEAGEFKPQILTDAIQLNLDGLNMDKVFELKDANKTEELYKYLLITQCNALSSILPRMFQRIEDYTELLLPDYLLREGSVIEQMIVMISEEDWNDQVQIIGWLYQYYNSEPKDAVFAALKKNIKISKENIPAATQLFTPEWIVRYMVENSLGRLWLEGHPNDELKSEWKYYLDEVDQEADVQIYLNDIRKEYALLKPEEIRCIDPCMGSGHILCYMFDVLIRIYEDYGYTAREAVGNIVEKNLWGLDIDERAAQLSYFAVMMKARQYDRRFFTREIQPHVYAIEESNGITSAPMHDMGIELSQEEYNEAVKQAMRLVEEMHDAKEYGSLIHVTPCNWELLRRFAVPRGVSEGQLRLDIHGEIVTSEKMQILINVGEVLAQKYHAVITNPPYMGQSGMSGRLNDYVKKNYPDGKMDLYSCFIEACGKMTRRNGYQAMITMHSWMFLTTFSNLRLQLLNNDISSLVHLGARAFEEIAGEVVQTVAFVYRHSYVKGYQANFLRLIEGSSQDTKEKMFLDGINRYHVSCEVFKKIPGNLYAYWLSERFIKIFETGTLLGTIADSKQGIATADNKRFLREWFEVRYDDIFFDAQNHEQASESNKKWYPYNKGGEFRKWYGNDDYVVNWQYDGQELKGFKKAVLRNPDFYFKECFSWSLISTGVAAFRYKTVGKLFDVAGMSCFSDRDLFYLLALCNSVVVNEVLRVIAPTINYQCGDIANIPVIIDGNQKEKIESLSHICVNETKKDWDDFEISWDFRDNPLVRFASEGTICKAFEKWSEICNERFKKVKAAEEEINRIFINIYGLQEELTVDVPEKNITIRRAEKIRDVKALISYAVGCMFGRFSLDEPGVIFAGNQWNLNRYVTYIPDKDNIIPICDDEYFEDDIVGRFINFIELVYGKENLEENIQFIAETLGGKGTARDTIRNYFINDFYSDHIKMYQKRPIYWLFDSGKKNGFKCLIYMHRYHVDTIARIRTDYVHEQQSRYRAVLNDIEKRVAGVNATDRIRFNKQLTKLQGQIEEINAFEENIHHLADQMIPINIDDGVTSNYKIFQSVLSKF